MEEQEFWEKLGMGLPDSEEVEERASSFEHIANSMYDMYTAFIESGFSEEQAWAFIFHQWIIGLQVGFRNK